METDKNQFIDALAILAFTTNIDYENKVQPISVKVKFFWLIAAQSKEKWMRIQCIMISNNLSNI